MDTSKYITLFVEESREHLTHLTKQLSRARQEGIRPEGLDEMFRHAHTLKGMASSMGFDALGQLTHSLEDKFSSLRKSQDPPPEPFYDIVLEIIDFFGDSLDEIVNTGASTKDAANLLDRLKKSFEESAPEITPEPSVSGSGVSQPETPSVSSGTPVFKIVIRIDPADPLPAARAMVALKKIQELGTVISTSPPTDLLMSGKFDGVLKIDLSSEADVEKIQELLEKLPSVEQFDVKAPEADVPAVKKDSRPSDIVNSVRIPAEHLDHFFNFASEFIVHEGKIEAAMNSSNISRALSELERFRQRARDFYEEIAQVRLVAFETLVPRLERVVRDASRQCEKAIHFEVSGSEVNMDRSILSELFEPLAHILRNSVDHGIEIAADREKAGKPSKGRIHVSLKRKSEHVLLEVKDDGKGLDPEHIKRIAIAKGYLDPSEADSLSLKEIMMILTHPGFSTRDKVSTLSGRGVGMDVVRTKMEALGGHLFIDSEPGQGTTISLLLPLTMSVIHAFLFESGGLPYAIPVSQVRRTLRVSTDMLRVAQKKEMVLWNEQTLSLLRLNDILGLQTKSQDSIETSFPALIISKSEQHYALAVDSIYGTSEIVVKPLGNPLDMVRQYSGATVLGDGRMALILDPENLI